MRKWEMVLNEVNQVVVGKEEVTRKIMMVILAKGHILLEDIPGVGKTTMANAFAKAMSLKSKRMQFTVDVLPSDVVGYTTIERTSGELVFYPGAVFTNVFLADEINRTSSKTQAALLEVMEEGTISVDGYTKKAFEPFLVIATQNPFGSAGTQLLPESQLDRFMVKLSLGYPSISDEIEMIKRRQQMIHTVMPVMTGNELLEMQKECEAVYVHDDVIAYAVSLITLTRRHQEIAQGASPRASLALISMAKACAYMSERDYVIPEDVQEVFKDVVGHRITLKNNLKSTQADQILSEILTAVPVRNNLSRRMK